MKKIIKIKTDKLFTDITNEVSEFAKKWGNLELLIFSLSLHLFAFGVQRM